LAAEVGAMKDLSATALAVDVTIKEEDGVNIST
jgi:hypothetical protein